MFQKYIKHHQACINNLQKKISLKESELLELERQLAEANYLQSKAFLQSGKPFVYKAAGLSQKIQITSPQYCLKPIGTISSDFSHKFEATRQPMLGHALNQISYLQLYDSTVSLPINSFVLFTFVFDRNFTFRNSVLAPRQTRRVGLFSSRTPHRPNMLGQSIGKIVGFQNGIFQVSGLDLLNGTPIVHFAIYRSDYDIPDAKGGWVQQDGQAGQLIPLYYDESKNAQGTFGEDFKTLYSIRNLDNFSDQIDFIKQYTSIDANSFITNQLQRVPSLTRTHKSKQENDSVKVLGLGIFRIEYVLNNSEIVVTQIKSSIDYEIAKLQSEWDPESLVAKLFIEKFG